ncbi:MAG: M4 family metallopeptidase [Thermoleophilia bacterium]
MLLISAILAGILSSILIVTFFVAGTAGEGASPSGDPASPASAAIQASLSNPAQIGSNANGAGESTLTLRTPDTGNETASGATLDDGQVAQIRWDADTGAPAFVTGSLKPPVSGSPGAEAVAFFQANKQTFLMTDPASELTVKRQQTDELGMVHLQLSQTYKGVPVFGSGMAVHFTAGNRIQTINGHYMPGIGVSVAPDITVDQAAATAKSDLGAAAESSKFEPPQLMILATGSSQSQLTWRVTLANEDPPVRMVYFIDAHTGEIAAKYDALEAAKSRRTYTAGNGTSIPGTLLISEGGSSGDAVAQAAHNNAGHTYDYYFNTFGRDSINGSGMTIVSSVHYSNSYNNAFWNGQQMVYGDGDGNVFSPLGSALDVVGHELTHGVTQYTADLVYADQPGALNESYSDVLGELVEKSGEGSLDWLMGEDVYTPHAPGDALRSLSNPQAYGQPANMSGYVYTSSDNGGVHTNSGIPNKAAYNIATAIGADKMGRIWYRALTLYLNADSQFSDARDASVQAAADLYGNPSAEVTAVQNGFSAVGIGAGQTSTQTARVEIDHTYRGDLVVTLGVGNPDSPSWSTVVSNRSGGSANNIYTTVDISGGAAYLDPSWQNRWFLKVYDAAGQDTGQITKFSITNNGTTFTATDTPVPVNDYQTSYSYVPSVDNTPPTVTAVSPGNGSMCYNSSEVSASFSEPMDSASVTNYGGLLLTRHDTGSAVSASVTYDGPTRKAVIHPAAALEYSTTYDAVVTTAVKDAAGNPLAQDYPWTFTTKPEPKSYYFTWYDQLSGDMKDWVVMGNPASGESTVAFDVYIGGNKANGSPMMVNPAKSTAASFAGVMGGPIRSESLDGKDEIISKRTLYGDSFEEITAMSSDRLDSTYYFTWYDSASPGSRNWVLIANPGATSVNADIYIGGQKMNSAPYQIPAGGNVTPLFAGVMGGPVKVVGYEPGSPSTPREILASQRVLWNGNFNEVMGIPALELENEYLFTWYDNQSAGARNWVLLANPNAEKQLAAEIYIGGQRMSDPATGNPYFLVPAGGKATPIFPGVMNGPVVVRGYDAATYNPASQSNAPLDFFTTQRSLFGTSFEEVAGYGASKLSANYHFSWYDQSSAGSRNWVLVSNPTATEVKAEVWIAGGRLAVLTIPPGGSQTPAFPGIMNGPVEVRGYGSATYDPANPGLPNHPLFTSQRVLWNGHFNEVEGLSLN